MEDGRPRNKWARLLTSRTVWSGVAMFLVPLLNTKFDLGLDPATVTGAMIGLGAIIAYLLWQDKQATEILKAKIESQKKE